MENEPKMYSHPNYGKDTKPLEGERSVMIWRQNQHLRAVLSKIINQSAKDHHATGHLHKIAMEAIKPLTINIKLFIYPKMKIKHIITTLLLISVLMVGCKDGNYKGIKPINESDSGDFQVIVIDSCEYLQNTYSAASPLTHKGNCKNPIHKK